MRLVLTSPTLRSGISDGVDGKTPLELAMANDYNQPFRVELLDSTCIIVQYVGDFKFNFEVVRITPKVFRYIDIRTPYVVEPGRVVKNITYPTMIAMMSVGGGIVSTDLPYDIKR